MSNAAIGQNSMRRVALASLVGTTVEFYDFFVFGTAAALVFNDAFFPALGEAGATLASMATFGVAFFVRPIGAVLFGHFGDRVGRKKTLVASLLLMGVATVLIGLLPDANSIGVAAPILLVFFRMCQGLAVGGEWAGAVLLTGENAPAAKRGRYAMFPQLGPSVALALVAGTFLTTSATMSDEQFIEFGWRIPFLASSVLVLIGLWVRLAIEETAAFAAKEEEDGIPKVNAVARVPFFEVVQRQPREVLLGAGSITALFAAFHVGATYMASYGTKTLGLSKTTVLSITILAAVVFAGSTIVSAMYSDKVGRRRVTAGAAMVAAVWSLALFPVLDIGSAWAFALGVSVTLGIVGVGYGPAGAQLPELFRARYRYTGAGVAYSMGGVFGGAMTPYTSEWLLERYSSSAIGVYLAVLSVVSLACILALAETRDVDMVDADEPDVAAREPLSAEVAL
jgi:MFS family permease